MKSTKGPQNTLDRKAFLPSFNSTFVEFREKECAEIIHDIVFQKYGYQRRLCRSKRLKKLREIFHPDINDSFSGADKSKNSVNDLEYMKKRECHHSDETKITRKVKSENQEFTRSETFYVGKNYDEVLENYAIEDDLVLNDSIAIYRRQMNLTYSQSVGSEDISDLLSEGSTKLSNIKNASQSTNDSNDNRLAENGNNSNEKRQEILNDTIQAQETAIMEFEKVLKFGRRKRGFAGSIPHIQAEKGLLLANIRKQAITTSFKNKFYWFSKQKNNLTGKITINNIRCDTNIIIGDHNGISPCYYVCVLQHKTGVLCTDIVAPDVYGIVEFKSKFEFENLSKNFKISMLLFKLKLMPDRETIGWKTLLNRRHFELPKLVLVGNHEISIANTQKTVFPFKNEILYANFTVCVNMPNKKQCYVTIQKIVRKNKMHTKLISHKRWCVLDGTDLKVYRSCQDVSYCGPIEVISLAYCKSCQPYNLSSNMLILDFVHTGFGRTLYLSFDNKDTTRDWLNLIQMAAITAKKFGL